MKLESISIIEWNKAPFNMDDKISREIRLDISRRFEVAIHNLRDNNEYNKLLLKDGWVIRSKDDVVFVLNPIKNEDIADNVDLKDKKFDKLPIGNKLHRVADDVWDCKTYSDLTKIQGLIIDQTTGKISYKVI
jgi:hypothetical protein